MNDFTFCKMQSLGNDFIVIDNINQHIALMPEQIQKLADRKRGVGCDQILVIGACDKADFSYTIYNADGSKAAHCGNGARCVARFVCEQGLCNKNKITFSIDDYTIITQLNSYEDITVEMGRPVFDDPFEWDFDGQKWTVYPVTLGNPHAIIETAPLSLQQMTNIGRALNGHPHFKQGVNVSFIQLPSLNQLDLQVYERGVGPTQACGSAASAAGALAMQRFRAHNFLRVCMPGGQCDVSWPTPNESVLLTGDANKVFIGQWHDDTA